MRLATSVYSLLTLTTTTKNQTLFLKVYSATSLKVQNRSNWFGSWLYRHIVHKIIGGNYGLKLDFDFWWHPGNKNNHFKKNSTCQNSSYFWQNRILLSACTLCWMRNIFDSLTRISISVTFLVSILYIFIMVSSVSGILNTLHWI